MELVVNISSPPPVSSQHQATSSPHLSHLSNLLIQRRLQNLRDILSPTHIKYILWHVYVGILPQLDESFLLSERISSGVNF